MKRSIIVKLEIQKSTFSTLAGVPQGSGFAPILFLIYFRGTILPAQISEFADFSAPDIRSHSRRILQEIFHSSLNILIKWCKKLKKKINPGKKVTYF